MATKTKYIKKGDWRTVEWFWNATGTGYFTCPAGAKIKVRYGVGWAGWNSQQQTLDGNSVKTLSIASASVAYARMQMKVSQSTTVTYDIQP